MTTSVVKLNVDSFMLGPLNIQFLVPKLNDLKPFLTVQRFNVPAISETWLSILLNRREIEGYSVLKKR